MKAVLYTEYGSPEVLKLGEVPKPVPKDNEILIRVRATSVNYGDLAARNFKNLSSSDFNMPSPLLLLAKLAFGLTRPKRPILGSELSGDVEAVGKNVKRLKVGDRVMGYLGQTMGAYAEYLCMPETAPVVKIPAGLCYEEAAVLPYGAIMALPLLRKLNIRPGQKVLVNGASGAIGAAAVQISRHFGAEVTGVCSTPRLAFVKALGADKLVDYTKEDFTQNGETYDLIFDVLGRASFSKTKNSLAKGGVHFYVSFKTRQLLDMFQTRDDDCRALCGLAAGILDDLFSVAELIEAGKLRAIIDKRFPLEQAAEAHQYVESGRKQGNVVITVN